MLTLPLTFIASLNSVYPVPKSSSDFYGIRISEGGGGPGKDQNELRIALTRNQIYCNSSVLSGPKAWGLLTIFIAQGMEINPSRSPEKGADPELGFGGRAIRIFHYPFHMGSLLIQLFAIGNTTV